MKSLVSNMPRATSVAKEIIPDSKLALLAVSKQSVTYRYGLNIGAEQVHAMSQHPEVALKWGIRDTRVFHRKQLHLVTAAWPGHCCSTCAASLPPVQTGSSGQSNLCGGWAAGSKGLMGEGAGDEGRASLDRYLLRESIFKVSTILSSSGLEIPDLCDWFGIRIVKGNRIYSSWIFST